MEQTQKGAVNQEHKQKAEDLFKEIADVIRENFVATYKADKCTLVMRLPSGQQFTITVADA